MVRRTIEHLYHLVDECNLPFIKRDGLLSTSQLLDRAGVRGDERSRLERQQRASRTILRSGAVLRDQSPMPASALARCLIDGTRPGDWYALLNTMVFFWLDLDRLLRQALACKPWPQLVLELDAARVLARYAAHAFVTPINIGNARRRAAPRGHASLVPLHSWLESGWIHESERLGVSPRPASHRPVELLIPDAVPDIMNYVVHIRRVNLDGSIT